MGGGPEADLREKPELPKTFTDWFVLPNRQPLPVHNISFAKSNANAIIITCTFQTTYSASKDTSSIHECVQKSFVCLGVKVYMQSS